MALGRLTSCAHSEARVGCARSPTKLVILLPLYHQNLPQKSSEQIKWKTVIGTQRAKL